MHRPSCPAWTCTALAGVGNHLKQGLRGSLLTPTHIPGIRYCLLCLWCIDRRRAGWWGQMKIKWCLEVWGCCRTQLSLYLCWNCMRCLHRIPCSSASIKQTTVNNSSSEGWLPCCMSWHTGVQPAQVGRHMQRCSLDCSGSCTIERKGHTIQQSRLGHTQMLRTARRATSHVTYIHKPHDIHDDKQSCMLCGG